MIFFSDIDHTLLDLSGNISSETRSAIAAIQKLGMKFILASARPPQSIRFIESQCGLKPDSIIAYNGSLLELSTGTTLINKRIDCIDTVRLIASKAQLLNISLLYYSGHNCYCLSINKRVAKEIESTNISSIDTNLDHYLNKNHTGIELPHKIMLMGDPNKLDIIEELLSCTKGIKYYRGRDTWIDIVPKEVSKGSAVKKLLQHMNYNSKNAIYFGDNVNDLSAFSVVGTSVAMGNSPLNVQKAASFVTKKASNHGVAFYIKEILQV